MTDEERLELEGRRHLSARNIGQGVNDASPAVAAEIGRLLAERDRLAKLSDGLMRVASESGVADLLDMPDQLAATQASLAAAEAERDEAIKRLRTEYAIKE